MHVNELRISICLVITAIDNGIVMGDITTIRKEAIQIGYLCCVQLKNPQKQKTFEHRLSEVELVVPVLEQTTREVRVYVLAMLLEVTAWNIFTTAAIYDTVSAMW